MTIRLDARNRPDPDILATSAEYDPDRTFFDPADVVLVVEVTSPESEHRGRTVKLRKYAEAGIRHYWCVGEEEHRPVVRVYELDEPTRQYVPTGIIRDLLECVAPFPIRLDLDDLV